VGKHLARRPLADLDAVLDRGSVVDAAPDAAVADLILEVGGIREVAVAQVGLGP